MKYFTIVGFVILIISIVSLALVGMYEGSYYEEEDTELVISNEYTPSQNLDISEGRFKEAQESISLMNG